MPKTYGTPSSKAAIVAAFEEQTSRLGDYAGREAEALQNQSPRWHYLPKAFDDALLEIAALGKPFDRQKLHALWQRVIADARDPGLASDLGVCTLQGDWLQVLERAFRARHHSACRSRIQPAGRLAGHRSARGVLARGLAAYPRWIQNIGKGEPTR